MIYFKISEFDSPDQPGSGAKMCPVFLQALDKARGLYGKPMKITNGYRTKEYGQLLLKRGYEVAKTSAHYVGAAADIACANTDLIEMLNACWACGFRRFGIMGGAIHVDSDATKPRPTMWDYKNTKGTARMKLAQEWFASKLKEDEKTKP
jgi:hypothetical protein